jgi:hypothetical protein
MSTVQGVMRDSASRDIARQADASPALPRMKLRAVASLRAALRSSVLVAAPLLALVVAACGGTRSEAEPESMWQPAVTDSGIALFFMAGPVDVGSTRAGLAAALGRPDSVAVTVMANRHDPAVTDSLFTLHYDGLVATVHRAGYDGRELLTGLTVLSDRYLQPDSPVRLGDSASAVRLALGEPDESDADTLIYLCDECLAAGYEAVRFHLVGDAVRRIEVHYWLD